MLSIDDTEQRLLLPVVIAVALAVLAAPIAQASEASPTPQSQIPGFLLDRGRYTTIEIRNARVETAPLGINDRGDIAGAYDDGKGDHGFMRDRRGRIITIDVPGARGTTAQKINNRGQITGVYSETSPDTQDLNALARGFLLDRGKFTRIDAVQTRAVGINNRGQVVGEYTDAAGMVHGFLWDKGQFTTIDVPGAAGTSAVDINDRGQIVGVHADDPIGATGLHGFLLNRGVYTTFVAPDALVTQPFDINNRGQIVGNAINDLAGTTPRAFMLAEGVEGDFTPIDFPGAPSTAAFGLNDRGQITGTYVNPNAAPDDQPSPVRMPMMSGG
jgi:probable HAF family extracellular repeat protein